MDPWSLEELGGAKSLPDILDRIRALSDVGNLAAVIVHLNDTYLIDPRPPRIPGMASIAGAINRIRSTVTECLGTDRTLVTHGGDYLAPARLSREHDGRPMIEILRGCGVTVATLGNHEFDYKWDKLKTRLGESQASEDSTGRPFATVQTNLAPRAIEERELFRNCVLWPRDRPFIAIFGYAGKQTRDIACQYGFEESSDDEMLASLVRTLEETPSILAIVILSHASRDEDRDLQNLVAARLGHRVSMIYILGGHDHHIDWHETLKNSILMKARANCQTLGVLLVPRDGLAAGLLRLPADANASADEDPRASLDDPALERAAGTLRQANPEFAKRHGEEFLAAFEDRISRWLPDEVRRDFQRGSSREFLRRDWISSAKAEALQAPAAGAISLNCAPDAESLPLDDSVQKAVAAWLRKSQSLTDGHQVVVDFGSSDPLAALEASIRHRSTNFGNFVADSIAIATGAELAVINAGCLRADDVLPAKLTVDRLRDALIYDGSEAGIVVSLRVGEIARLLEHAKRKPGRGAFVQVSGSYREILERPADNIVRIAMVRHMVASGTDEDKYREAIKGEGESTDEVRTRVMATLERSDSLEAWIRAGAGRVQYSHEMRVAAARLLSELDRDAERLMGLVDAYRMACRNEHRSPVDLIGIYSDPQASPQIQQAIGNLVGFVADGASKRRPERDQWYYDVYKRASQLEANYSVPLCAGESKPIRYQKYLDSAVEVFGRNIGRVSIFRWPTDPNGNPMPLR